jgi:CRP-like cAMP-binding protein
MRDNPTLSAEQIGRIRSVAQLRRVCSGEVLYEPSQPDVPLFIVLEGSVSISSTTEDDKILAVREAGQFTGEMSVISGKRSLLKARVTGRRLGSVKRVASAVGEGSMAVHLVHRYLAEHAEQAALSS